MVPAAPGELPGKNATIHVVDDDDAVRDSIGLLLHSWGYAVRAYPSARGFLAALPPSDTPGECVLTDIRMPGMDGLELLVRLKDLGFPYPVIVMTAHGDVSTAVQAMKHGAVDFIEKPFEQAALLGAVRAALSSRPADAATAGLSVNVSEAVERISRLSPREREVLEKLAAGKPNKVVAFELGISTRTAEIHRARLMEHLGAQSLSEMVRLAVLAEIGGQLPPRRP